jgi:hypothetical protein
MWGCLEVSVANEVNDSRSRVLLDSTMGIALDKLEVEFRISSREHLQASVR